MDAERKKAMMNQGLSGRQERRWQTRATRLAAARHARSRTGTGRHKRNGQSLIIFALSITVLLGLAGLSVDVMRLYDLYAREQRAAEAGALAAVLYMPCFYLSNSAGTGCTGSSADGNSAVSRAMQEVYRNGFGTLPSGVTFTATQACPTSGTVEVAVCSVTNKTTDVRVTITETANVFLLSALNITQATISASAQAEYLPPIQMGSRQNYFGDEAECSSTPTQPATFTACDPHDYSKTHVQNFLATMNGPAELKENGDPYVYCEEGGSQSATTTDANWNTTSGYPTYNGFPYPNGGYSGIFPANGTNHPQYAFAGHTYPTALGGHCGQPTSTTPGNPDQQPTGYVGTATAGTSHPGAYNYYINIDQAGSSVWIYNPNEVMDGTAWTGGSPGVDYFMYPYQYYGSLTYNNHLDDPSMYFNMTYSLYSVSSTYLRSADTLVTSQTFPPYDKLSSDLSAHGCATGGTQAYDLTHGSTYSGLTSGGCQPITSIGSTTSTPTGGCYHTWCAIATNLAVGTYRLAVEATGKTNTLFGWGSKSYAVKVCGSGATSAVGCLAGANTTIGAWNNMDVFFETPNSALFDLANVQAQYAGRTITISIYDPGDSYNGDVFIRLVPPAGSGATVTYPTGIRTGLDDKGLTAIYATDDADHLYNGLWINVPVTLPSNYTGGWWQVYYSVTANPTDKVAVKFDLVGSPVHLVPIG